MKNTIKFSKDWLVKLSQTKPEKRIEYKDSDNKFLRAIHHPTGTVTLCIYKCPRGQVKAARVTIPISVNDAMPSMQQVRAEANKVIVQLDAGVNPNQVKPIKASKVTLQEALDKYLEASCNTKAVNLHYRRSIEKYLADYLDKPLADLCTPIRLLKAHRDIKNGILSRNQTKRLSGEGGIGANEVMKKLRRILNFNRALDRSQALPQWPTEELGKSGLKMWLEQKPRTSRVHKEELPAFWAALESLQCSLQRDLFKFLLLTGCRSAEARKLRQEDVNFHRWTVTFKNTKNGLDHTLPLTETLKDIVLNRLSLSEDGRLFPLFDPKAVTKHIKRASGLHITPHDLRRTFAGIAEAAGIGSTMKKDLLNHLSGRDVTDDYTGYTDSDDLREALERIEAKLMQFINKDTKQKEAA